LDSVLFASSGKVLGRACRGCWGVTDAAAAPARIEATRSFILQYVADVYVFVEYVLMGRR
jgi:hypothetical protein